MGTNYTEIEQQILNALKEVPLTSPQLAEKLGCAPNKIRPRLTEMWRGGRLHRIGDATLYTYSLPEPQLEVQPTGAGLQNLLQDTLPLFGLRVRVSVPLPEKLQDHLATSVMQGKLIGRQSAPDQCDYLAVGALLVLRILEAGGSDAEHLRGLLASMREETRTRQARRDR